MEAERPLDFVMVNLDRLNFSHGELLRIPLLHGLIETTEAAGVLPTTHSQL